MKFAILKLAVFTFILILAYGFYLYSTQEDLLFHPKYLQKDFKFELPSDSEEINLLTEDNKTLNSLLVKIENPKGLVFFLHGNSGSIADWTNDYKFYQDLGYDYLVTDYRSFGKSTGIIENEEQVLNDALFVFDNIIEKYEHKEIIIIGYSFGTSIAAYIASERKSHKLVLLAPFYSLKELKSQIYPLFPSFLLKYNFETFKYLDVVEEPILIFHGEEDNLIGLESSLKLKNHLKKQDRFVILKNQGHKGITSNSEYLIQMTQELDSN